MGRIIICLYYWLEQWESGNKAKNLKYIQYLQLFTLRKFSPESNWQQKQHYPSSWTGSAHSPRPASCSPPSWPSLWPPCPPSCSPGLAYSKRLAQPQSVRKGWGPCCTSTSPRTRTPALSSGHSKTIAPGFHPKLWSPCSQDHQDHNFLCQQSSLLG